MSFWANIVWPVWKIRDYKRLWTVDNITYIESYWAGATILDNKNLSGDFSSRRLKIPKEDRYKLDTFFISLEELYSQKKGVFIDSSGLVFKMQTSNFVKITAHEISEIRKVGNFTYFLHFKGIYQPLEYNTMEDLTIDKYPWAYLIYSNRAYTLYSLLSEEPEMKKIRRKVA